MADLKSKARLTFNYWRRGGYQVGSEDYRWEIVEKYAGPLGMFVFDVVFIALSQNVRSPNQPINMPGNSQRSKLTRLLQVLLLAITTPTYILLLISRMTNTGMEMPDTVFSRLLILLVLVEFFADQQQWGKYCSLLKCAHQAALMH